AQKRAPQMGFAALNPAYGTSLIRLASRASCHLPSVLRRIVNVQPARRIGLPPGGVTVRGRQLRRKAQAPSTLSARVSLVPSILTSFVPCAAAARASLPSGARPTTVNTTSSAIRLSTVAVSPAWLAAIQVDTRSRIARSSSVMNSPRCRAGLLLPLYNEHDDQRDDRAFVRPVVARRV